MSAADDGPNVNDGTANVNSNSTDVSDERRGALPRPLGNCSSPDPDRCNRDGGSDGRGARRNVRASGQSVCVSQTTHTDDCPPTRRRRATPQMLPVRGDMAVSTPGDHENVSYALLFAVCPAPAARPAERTICDVHLLPPTRTRSDTAAPSPSA